MNHPNRSMPWLLRLLVCLLVMTATGVHAAADTPRKRIFIVSSYHKTYIWSQSTQKGVNAAMLKFGYLDNEQQAQKLVQTDSVESSKAVIRKEWMDTKRKDSRADMANATTRILAQIQAFKPDLVLLGDDNAAKYIGGQLLDSPIPVVFWGINGLPLKYGLVDSMDAPGRNVTGVWQTGYHKESLDLLKRMVPTAKTFAILACDSESARPNVKMIEQLAQSMGARTASFDDAGSLCDAFGDVLGEPTRPRNLRQGVETYLVTPPPAGRPLLEATAAALIAAHWAENGG